MATTVNFNASVPTNFANGVSRALNSSPMRLASFGMTIFELGTDVLLDVNVGFTSTAGTPQILFKVFRGTQVVGTTLISTAAVNEFRNGSFKIFAQNAPTGTVPFRLTAEIINDSVVNQATIVGPIVFSGEAIR